MGDLSCEEALADGGAPDRDDHLPAVESLDAARKARRETQGATVLGFPVACPGPGCMCPTCTSGDAA